MCKNILARNIYVRSKFCVRSSHNMCARAHVHSVEGTLLVWRHYAVTELVFDLALCAGRSFCTKSVFQVQFQTFKELIVLNNE